jgi:dihydroxy-acid dehydratase
VPNRELRLELPDDEIGRRIEAYDAGEPRYKTGVLGKYARHVGSAAEGAVTS